MGSLCIHFTMHSAPQIFYMQGVDQWCRARLITGGGGGGGAHA